MDRGTRHLWVAKAFIGRTHDGDRVFAQVNAHSEAGEGKTTIHHKPAPNRFASLSFTGEWYRKHSSHITGCGMLTIAEDPLLIAKPNVEAGWTSERVHELGTLAKRYHLNNMRAGCAHQPNDHSRTWVGRYPSLGWEPYEWPVCTESGYKWGSAWLVAPVPVEVMRRLRKLFTDDVSNATFRDLHGTPALAGAS